MAKKKDKLPVPEWSYTVSEEELQTKPLSIQISPNDEERRLLAERLDVKELKSLRADLKLDKNAGTSVIHISGDLQAEVVQACVVTMEPVTDKIQESFEAWYADPDAAILLAKARRDKMIKQGHTEVKILEEYEDPEPVIDGAIDVGELVTQHLSLAINPYPHAEGAELPEEVKAKGDKEELYKNPFAALKDWKKKQD